MTKLGYCIQTLEMSLDQILELTDDSVHPAGQAVDAEPIEQVENQFIDLDPVNTNSTVVTDPTETSRHNQFICTSNHEELDAEAVKDLPIDDLFSGLSMVSELP